MSERICKAIVWCSWPAILVEQLGLQAAFEWTMLVGMVIVAAWIVYLIRGGTK